MPESKPRYLYSLCRTPVFVAIFWLILAPAYSWLIRPLDNMSIMTVHSLQWDYFRTMLPRLVGLAALGAFLGAWGVSAWLKRHKMVVKNLWAWRIGKAAGMGAMLLTLGYVFMGFLACGMPGNISDPRFPDDPDWKKGPEYRSKEFRVLPLNYETTVPEFAHLAGMYVGYSGMEWMERYYGHGHPYTGGHPQGAREWRSREDGWFVNADGFNYSDGRNAPRGRTIDFIKVSAEGITGKGRSLSIPQSHCLFMECVRLGMTVDEVRTLLKEKLPPPTVERSKYQMRGQGEVPCILFRWKAKGVVRLNHRDNETKKEWTATLIFVNEQLVTISISS